MALDDPMHQLEGRQRLRAEHDRALGCQMHVEQADRQFARRLRARIEHAARRPWDEALGHQHDVLQPLLQLIEFLPVRLRNAFHRGERRDLEQDLVDPPLHAFERPQQVAPPVVGQHDGPHRMRDQRGDDRADRDERQLGDRRLEISAEEIRHEGEHADRMTAGAKDTRGSREEDDQKKSGVGDQPVPFQPGGDDDDHETGGAAQKPGYQLPPAALVAHRHAAFDGQHDPEPVGRRRQRKQQRMNDKQHAERQRHRQCDAQRHPQPRQRRIVGKQPIAEIKTGKQAVRAPERRNGVHRLHIATGPKANQSSRSPPRRLAPRVNRPVSFTGPWRSAPSCSSASSPAGRDRLR